jgi:hypothetical protein
MSARRAAFGEQPFVLAGEKNTAGGPELSPGTARRCQLQLEVSST